MKNIKTAAGMGLAAVALTVGLAACSDDEPAAETSMPASQTAPASMPSQSMTADDDMGSTTATGTFMGANGKSVMGRVSITADEVMLSGFSSDQAPDLHLYLTNGTDGAAVTAGKELGSVAYDKASQTFGLDGVDAASYRFVVVHCDKAKAVFGTAEVA